MAQSEVTANETVPKTKKEEKKENRLGRLRGPEKIYQAVKT